MVWKGEQGKTKGLNPPNFSQIPLRGVVLTQERGPGEKPQPKIFSNGLYPNLKKIPVPKFGGI